MKNEEDFKGEDLDKKTALLLAGYLNEAACHLKLSEDIEALSAAEQALQIDPKNQKGLFRMASVCLIHMIEIRKVSI